MLAIRPFNWLRIMCDHEMIMWLIWVNENICQQLKTDYYKTTDVKLRIATGMLNRIESLTDEEKIQIHSNLTNNIRAEMYRIQEELLPF